MRKAAAFLLVLGLLQMAGDLLGLRALKGFGAATTASPAPRIFSSVSGLETYSTKFLIQWTDDAGANHLLQLTPQLYSKVKGPYNRRNVFGAALAYGPVMPKTLRDPVMKYALCGDAPLLRELGINPSSITSISVRLEPLSATKADSLEFLQEITCR